MERIAQRLRNLTFILKLGKSIRTRLDDITSEPLTWEMLTAMSKSGMSSDHGLLSRP